MTVCMHATGHCGLTSHARATSWEIYSEIYSGLLKKAWWFLFSYWLLLMWTTNNERGQLYIDCTMWNMNVSHSNHRPVLFLKWGDKIKKINLIYVSTHSLPSLPPLFCWQHCWFPDLEDSMTRSAGRWSPFAALTTSPTATWFYQPHTSRGRERGRVAVGHTGKEGWVGRGAGEETMRFGLVIKKKKEGWEDQKKR